MRLRNKTPMALFGNCLGVSVQLGGLEVQFVSCAVFFLPKPGSVSQGMHALFSAFTQLFRSPGAIVLLAFDFEDINTVTRTKEPIGLSEL